MAAKTGGGSVVQPLHPPCPKSPPKYPDLYGKRREKAKVQMLEREITFLEEELKSVEGFQPASRSCKEVTDFVMANSDPYIPPSSKNPKSCGFWKWLCGLPCCNSPCLCCCCNSGCSRCDCNLCNCRSCDCMSCNCCSSLDEEPCRCGSCKCSACDCSSCSSCCRAPKWRCCSCPKPHCCSLGLPPCTNCCSCRWKCSS
ncbi:guanine nucleotide-binding protein subunit gamma 3-like [Hibiscus syriacus]|uniref:guanine nucleotide-binding protein subunit gamma 3-like n=1 Tax=Hibiscus syriacus TaxID=106335 RepID=UPI001924D598|nr:guanine nucleotide-binding protein subunit gamma 3-like [Hibiscus syriacus]